jgi:uncharacterized protein YdiU (UPF0061 family)
MFPFNSLKTMPSPEPSSSVNQPVNQQDLGWQFDNSYIRLPEFFYSKVPPVPVQTPQMVFFNHALAEEMGLNAQLLDSELGARLLSGNLLPEGADPIAQAYAGHQFGHFTMLGDGRAILLGEQLTPGGQRLDLQLKGSGRTPYSRGGDGRAALGPMLREVIISEAMHALGIPTTRSLAVVTTGEPVFRDEVLPGAILTRIAASHIRVGTFQYAATWGGADAVAALADYTMERHYPEAASAENKYLALFEAVMAAQAKLVTQWQMVGFIHGVMNTDNMTLSGETIDYGPCAFMNHYDPLTVFSSIDHHGRYAYANQPPIAQWNLVRFVETLVPLIHPDTPEAIKLAEAAINTFPDLYQRHWLAGMRSKMGLLSESEDDKLLITDLLVLMQQHQADFTQTFRALSLDALPQTAFYQEAAFQEWYSRWQARLAAQPQSLEAARERMRRHNPDIIPRNHRVEEALDAATQRGDFTVMARLLDALKNPYEDAPSHAPYQEPPPLDGPRYQTFCGT